MACKTSIFLLLANQQVWSHLATDVPSLKAQVEAFNFWDTEKLDIFFLHLYKFVMLLLLLLLQGDCLCICTQMPNS